MYLKDRKTKRRPAEYTREFARNAHSLTGRHQTRRHARQVREQHHFCTSSSTSALNEMRDPYPKKSACPLQFHPLRRPLNRPCNAVRAEWRGENKSNSRRLGHTAADPKFIYPPAAPSFSSRARSNMWTRGVRWATLALGAAGAAAQLNVPDAPTSVALDVLSGSKQLFPRLPACTLGIRGNPGNSTIYFLVHPTPHARD